MHSGMWMETINLFNGGWSSMVALMAILMSSFFPVQLTTCLGQCLILFTDAIQRYGLPPHVLTDVGAENIGSSLFMLNHPACGPGRRSMIVGGSVHNRMDNTRKMSAKCSLNLSVEMIFIFDEFANGQINKIS